MSQICAPTLTVYYPDESVSLLDDEQVEILNMAAEGMEAEFWGDMLDTFTNEIEPRFDLVAQACANEDAPNLRKYVHFIAGSAANLGLQRLSKFCRNIETALDDGTFSAFGECTASIRSEFDASVTAIRAKVIPS
ncbi:MAG: Hpt domain-containing protein [Opitutales bacterium]